jgi:hypothetical protein
MFWVHADPLREQVGGGWALEIQTFLGSVKWHRAVRRVPFGAQKVLVDPDPRGQNALGLDWIRALPEQLHFV